MEKLKETYRKPTLISIQLIPGENVLAICQDGTLTGQESTGANCQVAPPVGCESDSPT